MPKHKLNRTSAYSLLILGLILVGFGWKIYTHYAVRADKQRFQQAQISINNLYIDIKSKVGEPDKTQKRQSCSHANLKYSEGPLVCDISQNFVFGVNNTDDANTLFQNINAVISSRSDLFRKTQTPPARLEPLTSLVDLLNEERRSQNLLENNTDMSCAVVYHYAVPPESHLGLTVMANQNLYIYLGCGANAKSTYFKK